MASPNACKKCNRHISRYTIDRSIDTPEGLPTIRSYNFKLCWGCGYFSIYPDVHDTFTVAILKNKVMIIDLIKENKLKPVL